MGRIGAAICRYIAVLILFYIALFVPRYTVEAKERVRHNPFPLLKGLEERVRFWEKVFAEYTSNQAIIHDLNYPEIIYEVIEFDPQKLNNRNKARKVRAAKLKYGKILRNIHNKRSKPSQLSAKERAIYKKFSNVRGKKKFLWASRNIHIQWGIKEKFKVGLVRAGRYQSRIKKIFEEGGLPQELTFMPHIESSFNYRAYSRAGAAGIWQFIPSTGRLFLKIDPYVDERLDPLISSQAAVKLLKRNYKDLGSWPLAITAYNHGLPGMLNAVKKTRSRNLATIIRRYRSRSFGYASKNFYLEFLAALNIAKNIKTYFGDLKIEPPLQYRAIFLPDYIDITDIKRYFSLTEREIRTYNPSLLSPVLESQVYVPKGFELKVPRYKGHNLAQIYAQIPTQKKYKQDKNITKYRVKRGDTLIAIAKKFRVGVNGIRAINRMGNSSLIRAGQVIRLPRSGSRKSSKAIVASVTPPKDLGCQPRGKKESGSCKSENKEEGIVEVKMEPIKNMPIKTIVSEKGPAMGWVRVEPEETLQHFAGWCDVPVQKLRQLNKLRSRQPIRVAQRIKVIFSRVDIEDFRTRRFEYHKARQEKFFSNYTIKKTITHTVKKKENVWYLCQNVYQIPFWLVMKYNPGKNLERLDKGDKLVIPVIARLD